MKEKVLEVLLIRHRHQNQKKMTENGGGKLLPTIRSFADIGKKGSFPKSIGNLGMIDSVKNKHLLRFWFFFCNTYTGTTLLRHKHLQVRIKWKTCKVLWKSLQTVWYQVMRKIPPSKAAECCLPRVRQIFTTLTSSCPQRMQNQNYIQIQHMQGHYQPMLVLQTFHGKKWPR